MQKFRWVIRMEHNDPEKEAYRVGEVSQVVSIDPYVLRYWEKMFPQLKPRKDETGQRIYTKSDIDTVLRIKTLLYEERFTIAGAKKKLSEEIKSLENNDELVEVLHNVKETLKEISDILGKK